MKDRFSTIDLLAVIHDLKDLVNLRVLNIYDINSKAYLIKFQRPSKKTSIIFESGMKIHVTNIDWQKAKIPSSFSMKLRKHIKQKRLAHVQQLGIDRIVDMQFGTEEFANHIIVELYDRGNVILTDHEYKILNLLRPRTDAKIFWTEKYPVKAALQSFNVPDSLAIKALLEKAKDGELLRRVLSSTTCYGPALLEHCLIEAGFENNAKVKVARNDIERLSAVCNHAQDIFNSIREKKTKGYLTVTEQVRSDGSVLKTYEGFYPYHFSQYVSTSIQTYDSFSESLDEFYSCLESQKIDRKALAAEREALKRLENVQKDHEERIRFLTLSRSEKEEMAHLLELNSETVDRALLVIRSAIANQMTWEMIEEMRLKAIEGNDPIAKIITALDLSSNSMTVSLSDPYANEGTSKNVPIDISLSAYQNARKLYDEKKIAVDKEKRTVESSSKALKSAAQKTKKLLETVRLESDIWKSYVPMWFEKFYWFISSEGYLVIGGRDAQQNELLVKRYLRPRDIYVHADVRGATSVVIRNKSGKEEIPSNTLNEAGIMAVCYSSAWEAKIPAIAWWVYHHQVSRTAPSGEYLPSGSFMIRGKKHYLLKQPMRMGLGLLFKLDDSSLERHQECCKNSNSNKGEANCDISTTAICREENGISTGEELELNTENAMLDNADINNSDDDVTYSSNSVDAALDEYPDVKIDVGNTLQSGKELDEEFTILQIGPEDESKKKKPNSSDQQPNVTVVPKTTNEEKKKNHPLTKREKHKANKINKKYRDQDDEEREIRLLLLGSKPKDTESSKTDLRKDKLESANKKRENSSQEKESCGTLLESTKVQSSNTQKTFGTESTEFDEEKDLMFAEEEETKMINSLTWFPDSEDTLLYAIATVAPYNVLQRFKYKVKLIPGTGKRGKAAKTAIALFQRSKDTLPQELTLMRALAATDQIFKNIPGKVSVQAKDLIKKQ
uniref:NFACT-R_1 domain-containing protein n=1 Tax=Syphacia muris TaxID=451379 RepID=A0A0N5AWI4_9BILA